MVPASALPVRFGGTFDSLRAHYNYRLYFVGQIVSYTGSFMQDAALPWFVLKETGSPVLVGLLVFARYGPFSVLGLFGGVVADRFDNRRVLFWSQVVSMAAAVLLTVAVFTHTVALPAAYILTAVFGVALAFDNPSKYALIYQLVGRRELPNAIALSVSLQNAARIAGPGLGGVIIATAGVGWCLLFNSLTYIAVLTGLLLMRPHEFFRPGEVAEHRRPLAALREGFSYFRRSHELQALMGVAVMFGIFGFSAVRTLLSVLAGDTLHAGAQTFGLLFAAYGSGAVLGGLASATRGRVSWRSLYVGAIVFSGGILVLAPLRTPILCAVVLMAIGASWTTWASVAQSIAVLISPEQMRGRVVSFYSSSLLVGVPFGALLNGWLADVGGTTLAFAVAGSTGLAATFASAVSLRRRRALAVEPASA